MNYLNLKITKEEEMKVIQTELKNYNRRSDNSVSLRADSLIEMSSEDIADIDRHRGDVAIVVLTDSVVGNEVNVDIDDILKNLPENDTLENYKSPSKRFRDVLWRLLEQRLGRKPSEEEFADYYKREYEKIIEHYKDKFED
jgi:hypothetical protein